MNKRLLTLLIVLIMALTSVPVAAAGHSNDFDHRLKTTIEAVQEPVIFQDTITVTKEGGKYSVGFVTLEFRKDFLPEEELPKTFHIKIFARDGESGIEINPDTNNFDRKVLIKVDAYEGFLFDETKGRNVRVDIKRQVIKAEHFSWYRFR